MMIQVGPDNPLISDADRDSELWEQKRGYAARVIGNTVFNSVAINTYDRGCRYAIGCSNAHDEALAAEAMVTCAMVAAFAAEAITHKVAVFPAHGPLLTQDAVNWDRLQLCAALSSFAYDVKRIARMGTR